MCAFQSEIASTRNHFADSGSKAAATTQLPGPGRPNIYFHIFIPFVCSKLLRNRTKLLVVQKFFGNRPEQKVMDKNVLGQIKNVSFRTRILFKKRIYSIFLEQKQQNESFRKPSCLTSRFEPEDLMDSY
jgi:hypothetical protein